MSVRRKAHVEQTNLSPCNSAVVMLAACCLLACSPGTSATAPAAERVPSERCGTDASPCACAEEDDDDGSCDAPAAPPKTARDAASPREPDAPRDDAAPSRGDDASAHDAGADTAPDAAATPLSVVAEPDDEAAHIYDPEVIHTFDVEVAPEDLARVDMNPCAEEYVPARLTFEGKTYEVGYRYKGSLGAFFPPCANPLTRQKQGKCSVKLSFNWKDPEQLFFGLKKLLFHAMNNDPSMLRERLGYGLFREMGVPASRATHAILRVNGQAQIYALVEEVDGRFTRSRFREGGKGNLYKEVWPVRQDAQAYLNALETNEDDDPSLARIQRFQEAVAAGPDEMASFMDVDVTTSYMAVDRVIINDDGAFHFYCYPMANNPTAPANHNYYWYEAKDTDRLWIVPWDLDYSMAEAENPAHLPHDWKKQPTEAECNLCGGVGGFSADGPPPGCDPVIKNLQAWQTEYEAKVDALIAGPFSKAAVDAKLRTWKEQLADAGYPVPEAAATKLTEILDRARMNRGFRY